MSLGMAGFGSATHEFAKELVLCAVPAAGFQWEVYKWPISDIGSEDDGSTVRFESIWK
jgi:hypothetical protein